MGGVEVKQVASASAKPSNVAVLMTVTRNQAPVENLVPSAFRITENDQLLDNASVELRLLDAVRVTAFHTVLLMDIGSTASTAEREQLGKAATAFITAVRNQQSVTVMGFDGSSETSLIGEFPVDVTTTRDDKVGTLGKGAIDHSRNLRGAVMKALDALGSRLEHSARPIRVGTLVVFSRGPDMAGRVSETDFEHRLSNNPTRLIYVDVSGDRVDADVEALSRNGRVDATSVSELPTTLERTASLVKQLSSNYYLVSYCSPGRSGKRRLRIDVEVVGDDLETRSGSLFTEFDASGFTQGCNALNPPRFTTTTPRGQ
jgi:hypothetical protein